MHRFLLRGVFIALDVGLHLLGVGSFVFPHDITKGYLLDKGARLVSVKPSSMGPCLAVAYIWQKVIPT